MRSKRNFHRPPSNCGMALSWASEVFWFGPSVVEFVSMLLFSRVGRSTFQKTSGFSGGSLENSATERVWRNKKIAFCSASYSSGQIIPSPTRTSRSQPNTIHQRCCSPGLRSSASTLLRRRRLAGLSSKISTRRIALPSCEIDSDTTAKNRLCCSVRGSPGSGN